MDAQKLKHRRAERRKFRVRKAIRGTAQKPRLSVFRSHFHIYAQLIDDTKGVTLAAASAAAIGEKVLNITTSKAVGKKLAEAARSSGIEQVVFDRGGYVYHGRVKALLDATREAGLNKSEEAGKPAAKEDGNE